MKGIDVAMSNLTMTEKTVNRVFKTKIMRTHEKREILLFKAYSSIFHGCKVISIDKEIPQNVIDAGKQYDKKCRVIYSQPIGDDSFFYMSYKMCGKTETSYWKTKFKRLEGKI